MGSDRREREGRDRQIKLHSRDVPAGAGLNTHSRETTDRLPARFGNIAERAATWCDTSVCPTLTGLCRTPHPINITTG
ncbi:hypothetical protein GWI33_021871 [Rhynchophorus ferrugineus]|uniref:Uncharacterized protein n=1 Tax=Rhynchophorus ferrugineus TaxID=354439 RepID=A0A834INV6_RHYFE|nr:hypothetical protein GWI33_021871 [Rhynchophorus ferrugineus]